MSSSKLEELDKRVSGTFSQAEAMDEVITYPKRISSGDLGRAETRHETMASRQATSAIGLDQS